MKALRPNARILLFSSKPLNRFSLLARATTSTSTSTNNHRLQLQFRSLWTTDSSNMAVSQRYRQPHSHPQSDFGSLFRLLDDWESHRSALGGISAAGTSFSPRFDVRETKDAYLLDGELPGINQKDINIEFSDPHTLVINGRAERSYTLGTPPGKRIEGGFQQPSVEMEEEGELSRSGGMKQGKGQQQGQHMRMEEGGGHRYWVSERSVGEFQRTFNFPTRVDQESVSAMLREGILSVKVPKAGAQAAKKIPIEHECTY